MTKQVSFVLRIPNDMNKALERRAKKIRRSKNLLILLILEARINQWSNDNHA